LRGTPRNGKNRLLPGCFSREYFHITISFYLEIYGLAKRREWQTVRMSMKRRRPPLAGMARTKNPGFETGINIICITKTRTA
jgi:hypothetical protein